MIVLSDGERREISILSRQFRVTALEIDGVTTWTDKNGRTYTFRMRGDGLALNPVCPLCGDTIGMMPVESYVNAFLLKGSCICPSCREVGLE